MARFDPLSGTQRSERMSRIKNRDTKPELLVRGMLWRLGYRYRLQGKRLPGKPDIVFKGRRKAIFVHGCFWHQHGCTHYRMPRTKKNFWIPKLHGNVRRDKANMSRLRRDGWKILVLWECQLKTKNLRTIERRLTRFMEG